jgi:hypothetical protein
MQKLKRVQRQSFSKEKLGANSRWASALAGNRDMKVFLESSFLKTLRRTILRSSFRRWKQKSNLHVSPKFQYSDGKNHFLSVLFSNDFTSFPSSY